MDTDESAINQSILQSHLAVEDLTRQCEGFLDKAHSLRSNYSSKIRLLIGLETEYISSLDLERLSDLLQQNTGRIDYLVGSIHHVNGLPIDFDFETFKRCMDSIPAMPMVDGSLGNDSGHQRMATFLDIY